VSLYIFFAAYLSHSATLTPLEEKTAANSASCGRGLRAPRGDRPEEKSLTQRPQSRVEPRARRETGDHGHHGWARMGRPDSHERTRNDTKPDPDRRKPRPGPPRRTPRQHRESQNSGTQGGTRKLVCGWRTEGSERSARREDGDHGCHGWARIRAGELGLRPGPGFFRTPTPTTCHPTPFPRFADLGRVSYPPSSPSSLLALFGPLCVLCVRSESCVRGPRITRIYANPS